MKSIENECEMEYHFLERGLEAKRLKEEKGLDFEH